MNAYRSFLTPGMFGGGGGGSVAGVSSSYYAQQNVRAYDSWWRNSCYNVTITELVGSASQSLASGSQLDFYVTTNGEVIPATLDGFNSNLLMLENRDGKYYGTDSYGPIRFRVNECHEATPNYTGVLSPFHTIPHFHIDRRINGDTGRWVPTYTGAMEMFYK